MSRAASVVVIAFLAGCASTADVQRAVTPGMASAEVAERAGKPDIVGKLVGGGAYWDYSRQPFSTERVTFGADDHVREVRNLLVEKNFENLRAGMTLDEVMAVVGPPSRSAQYADQTTVWTYRYQDVGIWKLLHVTMGPEGRLLRYDTEWDPTIYSKGRGGK